MKKIITEIITAIKHKMMWNKVKRLYNKEFYHYRIVECADKPSVFYVEANHKDEFSVPMNIYWAENRYFDNVDDAKHAIFNRRHEIIKDWIILERRNIIEHNNIKKSIYIPPKH